MSNEIVHSDKRSGCCDTPGLHRTAALAVSVTPSSLNELVARKLGYPVNSEKGMLRSISSAWADIPAYSTSIEAAWEIVGKVFDVKLQKVSDEWQCELNDARGNSAFDAADTAPLAICKAFLKLQEVK